MLPTCYSPQRRNERTSYTLEHFFFKIWIFQNKATDAYLIMKINRVRHYLSHDSLYLFPVLFPYSTSLSKEQVMSSHLQWLKNINSSKTCMQSLFSSPLHTAQSTLIKDRRNTSKSASHALSSSVGKSQWSSDWCSYVQYNNTVPMHFWKLN